MTQEEFVRQVQMNQGIILKVCHLYAHSIPDRQDLFQEIVIQLWKAVPKFKEKSKLSTWMYRVALNTAISDFRKKKRSPALSEIEVESLEINIELNETDTEEHFKTLYAAIDRLSEIEKAIVVLYLENKSYEEMEDILGINTNNLRVKMNRIREKLRQLTKTITHGT
jgi:RNA polymerase sigma-70 factor, ECF subfamily